MILYKIDRDEIINSEVLECDTYPFLIGCDMQDLEDLLDLINKQEDPPAWTIHWRHRLEQITGLRPVDRNGSKKWK